MVCINVCWTNYYFTTFHSAALPLFAAIFTTKTFFLVTCVMKKVGLGFRLLLCKIIIIIID